MKSYKPSEEFRKRKAEFETKAKSPTLVVAERLTNPVEDYFTYLLLNWRQVHLANPGYSGRHTQEEVWRVWQGRPETSEIKKGAKAKAAKDPLAPKKPLTAFFLFCRAKRAEVVKALPSLRPKEVTVELGRLWNELGEEEKAPYVSEYTKLWKEFKLPKSSVKSKKKTDVMDEKEGDDMEEIGDGNMEVNLVAVDTEVNLEVSDVEVNMKAEKMDVNS